MTYWIERYSGTEKAAKALVSCMRQLQREHGYSVIKSSYVSRIDRAVDFFLRSLEKAVKSPSYTEIIHNIYFQIYKELSFIGAEINKVEILGDDNGAFIPTPEEAFSGTIGQTLYKALENLKASVDKQKVVGRPMVWFKKTAIAASLIGVGYWVGYTQAQKQQQNLSAEGRDSASEVQKDRY